MNDGFERPLVRRSGLLETNLYACELIREPVHSPATKIKQWGDKSHATGQGGTIIARPPPATQTCHDADMKRGSSKAISVVLQPRHVLLDLKNDCLGAPYRKSLRIILPFAS
jgi:hypothetical protein